MTDVRLTATNPEDSSAVPVACNSRGELLIVEPTIEEIPNALDVQGRLMIFDPADTEKSVTLEPNGYAQFRRESEEDGSNTIRLCQAGQAIAVKPWGVQAAKFQVRWDGTVKAPNVSLLVEADNPDHYTSSTKDGESVKEYSGPVIDLVEELQFLRAQVQALMERLKMTPEGGWPVWDGSE